MDFKSMLHAISRPRKNAVSYDLSTDFKYTGLQEYPRPQLQRKSYINLNGKWDYRILSGQGRLFVADQLRCHFRLRPAFLALFNMCFFQRRLWNIQRYLH